MASWFLVETNLKPFVSLQSKNVSVDNEVKSHLDLVLYFGKRSTSTVLDTR